jgi:paraquat-inducible protein B
MRSKSRPAAVGAFILLFVGLVVAAIALWGAGRVFGSHYRYICYFGGSVNGLVPSARVKFRGVPVGHVREMSIVYPQAAGEHAIAVVIEIERGGFRDKGHLIDPTPEAIGALIQNGLRAQLELESLITNLLFVSLEIPPDAVGTEPHRNHAGMLEIPTAPSEEQEFVRALYAFSAQLSGADVAGLILSIQSTASALHDLVADPKLHRTLNELAAASTSIRQLAATLSGEVRPTAKAVRASVRTATTGAASLGAVLSDLHDTIGTDAPLRVEVQRTLVDVQRAARSVSTLADLLERNPNALIIGKRP